MCECEGTCACVWEGREEGGGWEEEGKAEEGREDAGREAGGREEEGEDEGSDGRLCGGEEVCMRVEEEREEEVGRAVELRGRE